MSYKDLLVTVDATRASQARIELAAWLAERFGAHLAGLYSFPYAEGPAYAFSYDAPLLMAAREQLMERFQQRAEEAHAAFEATLQRHGVSGEWRTTRSFADEEAALHARYADLAIVGQLEPGLSDFSMPRPEDVTLASGCPMLVIPYTGSVLRIERHAIVGWNASREARRAVADALPLLRLVRKVTVIAVNPRRGISGHGEEPGADIALHLARHGVTAEVEHAVTDELDPADQLLSRAADLGSDLLVMGAYSHARVRELVLGGTTRSILKHMTVPVLMSH
jgi:nucleotide-binding universal stress UspA family protein